ncbi:MAG TPA: 3-dehydroquinate synthase [Bacteroidia bacterium]|nr:3-dehydroquinate synthase [Bacteroidia bacterium]
MQTKTDFLDSIYFGQESLADLQKIVLKNKYSSVFILCDENTEKHCLPSFIEFSELESAGLLIINAGETEKTFDTVSDVCKSLLAEGADRKALLINLGGGVVSDIGGFAASIYKRGIDFINVPTTLMAMVDASIGGKTGVNLSGSKNSVGLFSSPQAVFIDSDFLSTLSDEEFHAGFAEVIKHALIGDAEYWNTISQLTDFRDVDDVDDIILPSVEIKKLITDEDFKESGIRKSLNFGHTLGHAYESSSMKLQTNKLLHGNAVALGMIGELFLSSKLAGFPTDKLTTVLDFLVLHYGKFIYSINESELSEFLLSDKKNENGKIGFYLLHDIGVGAGMFFPEPQLIEEAVAFTKSILTE